MISGGIIRGLIQQSGGGRLYDTTAVRSEKNIAIWGIPIVMDAACTLMNIRTGYQQFQMISGGIIRGLMLPSGDDSDESNEGKIGVTRHRQVETQKEYCDLGNPKCYGRAVRTEFSILIATNSDTVIISADSLIIRLRLKLRGVLL